MKNQGQMILGYSYHFSISVLLPRDLLPPPTGAACSTRKSMTDRISVTGLGLCKQNLPLEENEETRVPKLTQLIVLK